MAPRINLVVAMDRQGVIGSDGRLPWDLPADLRRFKAITMGHPLVMGRRTHESIGRPLPGRRNVVVSERLAAVPDSGIEVVRSFDAARRLLADASEIMVIGGARLYRSALPAATRIFLTEVHAEVAGDVSFPPFERADWCETAREDRARDARHDHAFSFVILERRRPVAALDAVGTAS